MSAATRQKDAEPIVLLLAQLPEQQPPTVPAWWNPDSCPRREFVRRRRAEVRQIAATRQPRPVAGGRLGPYRVSHPAPRRVLVCQFELPVPQFVGRLATMRRIVGNTTDQNLFVDTRATGHLLQSTPWPESLPLCRPRRSYRNHRSGPALSYPTRII
jgi:hypothetical protein